MKVQFLASAAAEYRDAMDYYDSEVAGLGEEFRDAVIEALHRISDLSTRLAETLCANPAVPHQPISVWTGLPSQSRCDPGRGRDAPEAGTWLLVETFLRPLSTALTDEHTDGTGTRERTAD